MVEVCQVRVLGDRWPMCLRCLKGPLQEVSRVVAATDGRCGLAPLQEVSHVLGRCDRWPIGPFRKFSVSLVAATGGRCVLASGSRRPMCPGPFRKFPVCVVAATDGRCVFAAAPSGRFPWVW